MTNLDIKLRFLRALAFEIHRKRPADQAMAECIEKEGQRGKHRALRPASIALETEGFVAAMKAAGLIGEEAATVLTTIVAAGDHRLLANAISSLADYHEQAAALG